MVQPPLFLVPPGNEDLARHMAEILPAELAKAEFRRYPDRESYLRLLTKVEGRQVIVIPNLRNPDEKIVPLLFLSKILREQGAAGLGLVAPYLPYMRQDKVFQEGEGVSALYFAQFLSGLFDWLVTVDPHLHRIHDLGEIYSIPTRVVSAAESLAAWIQKEVKRPLLLGPDVESQQWVAAVARQVKAPYLILKKKRLGDRKVEISIPRLHEFQKHTPLILDDIISTARTMIETVRHLKKMGVASPVCVGTHAVFAFGAYEDLQTAGVSRIVTCNTIPHPSNAIDLSRPLCAAISEMLSNSSWI